MWRLLKRQVRIDDAKLRTLLGFLTFSELRDILSSRKLLESLGIIEADGRVKYAVVMEIIKYAAKVSMLRQQIIDYVVKNFEEEIRKALGIVAVSIDLEWSGDFEKRLTEKKNRPISQRTLRDCRNIFKACLESRELNDQLIRELEKPKMLCGDGKEHSTGWLRQVLRHYIAYLYTNAKLDWDTYTRLLMVIRGRKYGRKVSQKPIRTKGYPQQPQSSMREEARPTYIIFNNTLQWCKVRACPERLEDLVSQRSILRGIPQQEY